MTSNFNVKFIGVKISLHLKSFAISFKNVFFLYIMFLILVQFDKYFTRFNFLSRAENYNTSAVEFLRRLPSVTDSNYRALMDGCNSLAELALLPIERLAELMGGQKSARTLKDFLDAKFPTLL